MENKYQKTVGKFLTKTKVITKDGNKPDLETIVARTLYRFLPFDRISFFFEPYGFHDYLSNTIVVKDDSLNKEDEQD